MGNSLSTSSARLAGISNLVGEVGNDVQYEKSMGSSRFLKAIRARHRNGPIVVKTFIKPDPGMSLRNLVRRLRVEREALADVPNVLTYQTVIETDRAGYLIRQWLASNLYDRISTRPFLTAVEKKWITYQLLYAMRDSRGRKIPHGDLKCENILVTSTLSVYVTDFAASFKPTYLPLDDPADFSFFFDTSGRRTCYVAPERFYEADSEIAKQKAKAKAEAAGASLPSSSGTATATGTGLTPTTNATPAIATGSNSATSPGDLYTEVLGLGKRDGKVTEAMDVFSLGCVIAELWRDGAPIFTLSQLFKYREGAFDIEPALAEIADPDIRSLVRSMISLDPADRLTFEQYLVDNRASAFPECFYSFLHQYLIDLQRTVTATRSNTSQSTVTAATGPSTPTIVAPSVAGTTSGGLAPTAGLSGAGGVNLGTVLRTEADERIERLFEDWSTLIKFLGDRQDGNPDAEEGHSIDGVLSPQGRMNADGELESSSTGGDKDAAEKVLPVQLCIPGLKSQQLDTLPDPVLEDGPAIIILSVLLANLRNSLRPSSKVHALDLLLHLSSRWLSDETKLDRVIPYIIALFDDDSAVVRMSAVRTCTQLLLLVRAITPSNASIFSEYLVPNIRNFSTDPSASVRSTYASCMVALAETGDRYLQMAEAMRADGMFAVERDVLGDFLDGASDESNYDAQLHELQTFVQDQVTTLLTDQSPAVKRSLLANITPLCTFFGVTKTNDVLLSHMITYLNDRDWLLRDAFFETIVGVATIAGDRSLEEYILPLMTQALSDAEEFVVAKVINGLTSLAEAGLFQKSRLYDLLSAIVGFLCHPNIWIREGAAGFISTASRQLPETDIWSMLYPSLRPLLKADVHIITELNLLDTVKESIPRPVFQAAVSWAARAHKTLFWKPPREAKGRAGLGNGLGREGISLLAGKRGQSVSRTSIQRSDEDDGYLDKLRALSMSGDDEVKLVAMRDYIWKLARQSSSSRGRSHTDAEDHSGPNNSQAKQGLEVQTLDGITPQTIFFSARPSASVPTAPDGMSFRPGSLRSQTDGSFSGQIARRRLAGQRIVSSGSTFSPLDDLRRRMASVGSNGPTSVAMSATPGPLDTPDLRSPVLASPSTSQPPGSPNGSLQAHNRLGVGKAAPAIASNLTNATGTMDLAAKLRALDSVNDSSGRTTPAGSIAQTIRGPQAQQTFEGPSFSSTYEGTDPYIRAHLEAVYLRQFRERIPELGPRISAGAPRRRGARSTLSSRDRVGTSGSNRRPDGKLIAYFTEHSGPITSIAVSPDHAFFVSGSEDGTVKVWDTARLEKNVTSRSRATYSAQKGAITAVLILESSHCVASAATDGSLHIWRVDLSHGSSMPRYGKLKLVSNFQLSTPGEYATSLLQSTTESTSTIILGTSHSRLTALDLRTMQVLQTLRNPSHFGPITCLCTDKKKVWLLVGTLGGVMTLWDMRFGLMLKSWRLGPGESYQTAGPSKGRAPRATGGTVRINKCVLHPSKGRGRWVLVAYEQLADAQSSASASPRPDSQGENQQSVSSRSDRQSSNVLVEVWDIDKGVRVETFETGSFPRSSSSSSSATEGKEEELQRCETQAPLQTAISAEGSSDGLTGAAAAIERLVREREARERERAEEEVKVEEELSEDEDRHGSAFGGARRKLSGDHIRPKESPRTDINALFVGLEGYSSSSSSSSGQVAGGWLDAGKLVAEAEGAPSSAANASGGMAGYMICAGEDRKIRFWDLGRTDRGVCIGTLDERSEFRSFAGSDTSSTTRHIHHLHSSSSSRLHLRSPLLANQQTQHAHALMRSHKDAITALGVIECPFRCIVAGDRSGTIRVWE